MSINHIRIQSSQHNLFLLDRIISAAWIQPINFNIKETRTNDKDQICHFTHLTTYSTSRLYSEFQLFFWIEVLNRDSCLLFWPSCTSTESSFKQYLNLPKFNWNTNIWKSCHQPKTKMLRPHWWTVNMIILLAGF